MTEKHDAILIAGKAIAPLVNDALRLREELVTARDDALEEAAAWHDKHLKGLMVVQEEHRLNDEPTAVQTQTSGAMAVHRHAAAAIRALKGKT